MKKVFIAGCLFCFALAGYSQDFKVIAILHGQARFSGSAHEIQIGDVYRSSRKVEFIGDSVVIVCGNSQPDNFVLLTNCASLNTIHRSSKIWKKIKDRVWYIRIHKIYGHMAALPQNNDDVSLFFYRFYSDTNAMLIIDKRKIRVDYRHFKDTAKGYFIAQFSYEGKPVTERLKVLIDDKEKHYVSLQFSGEPVISNREDIFHLVPSPASLYYVNLKKNDKIKLTDFSFVRVKSESIVKALFLNNNLNASKKNHFNDILNCLNTFYGSIDADDVRQYLNY